MIMTVALREIWAKTLTNVVTKQDLSEKLLVFGLSRTLTQSHLIAYSTTYWLGAGLLMLQTSQGKGVSHYLFVIVVSGSQHALVSELVSVATVDETFTLQDEKFGRGANRASGVDLGPFLDTKFGTEPERLVPSWRRLDQHQRKMSLIDALRGSDLVAPNRLQLAARYGAVDLVVRLRGRSDVRAMRYTQALNYIVRALSYAHKHAQITANPDAPLPFANAVHEREAREAARRCGWPSHEPQALRSLLHKLATDLRLHENAVRQRAFETLRGDAFFGDQSPWLAP